MPTTPDPHEPTRADLPPATSGGEPTAPMDRTDVPPATRTGTAVGERQPLRDDDRHTAWWLWALLALVLIGIVVFALVRDNSDDDDVDVVDDVTTETAPLEDAVGDDAESPTVPEDSGTDEPAATTSPSTTQAPAAGEDADDPATSDDTDPGTVTAADGTDLLGLVQGDADDAERLAPHADADVVGERVQVLGVVEGEGFWIGTDDRRRIFAHGADEVASAVEVGQRIGFEGFLKPNPASDSADAHDIPDDQGAELHRQQGHHIELRSITPAS